MTYNPNWKVALLVPMNLSLRAPVLANCLALKCHCIHLASYRTLGTADVPAPLNGSFCTRPESVQIKEEFADSRLLSAIMRSVDLCVSFGWNFRR
jgi:hypothetical protein